MRVLIATAVAVIFGPFVAFSGAETAPKNGTSEDGVSAASLSGVPGAATEGGAAFIAGRLGNCLPFHLNSAIPELVFSVDTGLIRFVSNLSARRS